jgi:hypothetical protein
MSLLDLPIYPWWWKGKPCNRDLALHATKNYRSDHGVTVLDRIRSGRCAGATAANVRRAARAATSTRRRPRRRRVAPSISRRARPLLRPATAWRTRPNSKLNARSTVNIHYVNVLGCGALHRALLHAAPRPRPRRAESGRACVWYDDIAAGQVRHDNSQVCDGVTTRHRPKWCERDRAREADLNNHFRTSTWRVEARSSWAEVLHTA